MRQLPRRMLASAVLSAAVAGGLIAGGVLLSRSLIRDAMLAAIASTASHAACEAEPAAWGAEWGALSLFAYDTAGVSQNPKAPPLEPALLRQALARRAPARAESSEGLAVAVLPMAPGGPCAVLRMKVPAPDPKALHLFLSILSVAMLAGMALAAIGVTVFVVLPLRRRVERLSQAASGVGRDGFAATDTADDALGTISAVLADSHARIVETRTALESRNRALEEHLAGIAHDLRTPLASLILSLEAVADEAEGPLHAEARRALSDAVYLSTLVDNLHQGARLRHALDLSAGRVELTELVARLTQRLAIVGRHAGVEVAAHAPDAPVWVACTPALAERAISNLVHNAVQHHNGEGHVSLILQIDAPAGRFTVVVDDDGPGLPEGLLADLHVEGFRTDAARQRGPGLGMVIAAEIARQAGWTLQWRPLEPRGTRAEISGPLVAPPPAASP